MEIIFSKHAVEQMFNRKITPDEVESVVIHFDGEVKQTRDKRVVYKNIKGRNDNLIAAVVVLQRADILEVITVMHNFEVRK